MEQTKAIAYLFIDPANQKKQHENNLPSQQKTIYSKKKINERLNGSTFYTCARSGWIVLHTIKAPPSVTPIPFFSPVVS